MWKELVARGVRVGKERVRKLMAQHGIRARHKRKYIATTNSNHNLPVAPNLLERNFTASAPNQVWTSDITVLCDGRRLGLSGCHHRSVQPAGGGLVDATAHDS
jgi:transposase InsO family protein